MLKVLQTSWVQISLICRTHSSIYQYVVYCQQIGPWESKYYFLQTIFDSLLQTTLNADMTYLRSRYQYLWHLLPIWTFHPVSFFYAFPQTWTCQGIIYCQHQTGFTGVRGALLHKPNWTQNLASFYWRFWILWLDESLLVALNPNRLCSKREEWILFFSSM